MNIGKLSSEIEELMEIGVRPRQRTKRVRKEFTKWRIKIVSDGRDGKVGS